jgi:outer membrane biogenesis lipoprotein LolB
MIAMKTLYAMAAAALLGACATPAVVETRKTGDAALSCEQIRYELAEADRFERDARAERKVTGTNVAAAVFFWPALLATYSNSDQAINAARERKAHLFKLADSRGCGI